MNTLKPVKALQVLVLYLLLGAALARPIPVLSAQRLEPRAADPLYVIQNGDILDIVVWKEPDVTRTEIAVRPDGRISIPLVQDIQAAGLNPGQLKERIEAELKAKEFITAPNVTVLVRKYQPYQVYVMGKVQRPGMLVSEKPLSVIQVLALAGGFVEFARPNEIKILRGSGEETNFYLFNYSELIDRKNLAQNMLLRSGDTVVVP